MSHEEDKIHHSERLHQKETKIERQMRIARAYGMDRGGWKYTKQPHRSHKKHILNCGDPTCYMCGNPRKFMKEKTMQEKRFEQPKLHEEYETED